MHGRNLTLIRYPPYTRLVQVGLPNRLRGEIWEVSSGSIFLRLQNPGVYAQILLDNKDRTNSATEDIEKDLHRSLPEYAAYQSKRGIDTMRRVLTAYAFSNPAVGYCQAMNLVVASFLIFMSEEQCFWCLSILCDRLLPGYYSCVLCVLSTSLTPSLAPPCTARCSTSASLRTLSSAACRRCMITLSQPTSSSRSRRSLGFCHAVRLSSP